MNVTVITLFSHPKFEKQEFCRNNGDIRCFSGKVALSYSGKCVYSSFGIFSQLNPHGCGNATTFLIRHWDHNLHRNVFSDIRSFLRDISSFLRDIYRWQDIRTLSLVLQTCFPMVGRWQSSRMWYLKHRVQFYNKFIISINQNKYYGPVTILTCCSLVRFFRTRCHPRAVCRMLLVDIAQRGWVAPKPQKTISMIKHG